MQCMHFFMSSMLFICCFLNVRESNIKVYKYLWMEKENGNTIIYALVVENGVKFSFMLSSLFS